MNTNATAPDPADLDLRFEVVDLIGRTGSHRRIERTLAAPARQDAALGGAAMQPPQGEPIEIEAELESVVEGIYVHGTLRTHLEGECSRCLDPVEQDIDSTLSELFLYPEKLKEEEKEDSVLLDGDAVDLTPLVRDTLAVDAEDRPLCRPDCPGLCAQCGFRMEDDPDHAHDVIDDRFAALQGFFEDSSTDSTDDGAEGGADKDRG